MALAEPAEVDAIVSLASVADRLVRVSAHGRWTRLSTATGHVLVR